MSSIKKALEADLRKAIDIDRLSMVAYVEKNIRQNLEHFLKIRQPNKTIYETYNRRGMQPPDGIREATNYYEAFEALGMHSCRVEAHRPAFEVVFKPNASEAIKVIAEREVEMMVATFVSRASSKLAPVFELKEGMTLERVASRTGFYGGAWTGFLHFNSSDGTEFLGELKIITNRSKWGKLFGQYPMTFHDAKLLTDNKWVVSKRVSIEDIWKSVGYNPPVADPNKCSRWKKLVGGSVVIHEGKRVFISTPKVAKVLQISEDAHQIARIEANESACYIEYADGRTQKYKYSPEEDQQFDSIAKDQSYNKASEARRQFAYKHFFPQEESDATEV